MSLERPSPLDRLLRWCLENKLIVILLTAMAIGWGIYVAPFDWKIPGIQRNPVPVDAIPDIGENQQIVFTRWVGRSPQDVEDQITYPLTVALLGVPGVRTIRSSSMFGFSSIYVVFNEGVEFYWSRSRILEKLASLPSNTLPEGVQPTLGPDATALGQVFWYTLQGRDPEGKPAGGWDLYELRTIQDWYVRYSLLGVEGVAEVASIGGFVKEYQIDVDPDAMRAYKVKLDQVFGAVRRSNIDVGARTIELNRVEYVIRGLGFLKSVKDLERTVVAVNDNVPIYLSNVAKISLGPALRRGALDRGGVEAVGGVVVVRQGANPLAVIKDVKARIAQLAPGLPSKTLADGTVSKVTVVPFYDRTALIHETLGTLDSALVEEILVTIIVVLVMVVHLRSSLVISATLPLAVLVCFIAMRQFGVDANVVSLSGIAIAIGTIVDMGIVLTENVLKHLDAREPGESRLEAIYRGASEVGSAVLTAVMTTVVSFLPVFSMQAAEGKLFKPLAFTKTFALIGSIVVAIVVLPTFIHFVTRDRPARWLPERVTTRASLVMNFVIAMAVAVILANHWAPIGADRGFANVVFVVVLLGGFLALIRLFYAAYEPILRACLAHKLLFLAFPLLLVTLGLVIWLGYERASAVVAFSLVVAASFVFVPFLAGAWRDRQHYSAVVLGVLWLGSIAVIVLPGQTRVGAWAKRAFPGLGQEFMPRFDEGSFLLMPVTQPHASIGEAMDVLAKQDKAIRSIPEISSVVGKIGRVESALDPAPVSMIETIINYESEYKTDRNGRILRFRFDDKTGKFARDAAGDLIPDSGGHPFRQWRPWITKPKDIWDAIAKAARVPGTTAASELGPIDARIKMLQTGLRAPFGVKVQGPDLETIERVGIAIENELKNVPSVRSETVAADRVVGKPYLEINIDREKIARYGITIRSLQDVIEVAIGGKRLTTTIEGRERYPVRVRYLRELRDSVEALGRILVPTPGGAQIPLDQLAQVRYRPGPQVIKSEDTFLTSYVVFDKQPDAAEVDVVEQCQARLRDAIAAGDLEIPPGVSYKFVGTYENQLRSAQRLRLVLPLALLIIFLILYFQFGSMLTSLLVFSGVFVAWAGGFLMLWLYGQPWFLNFTVFGVDVAQLFQVRPYNLSVAVWVGFLALFGIATDDGVILSTYLREVFEDRKPDSVAAVREATVHAGKRRIRPCLMTIATTVLALLPVLTSTGKGSDIMVPMAIPSFGGMTVVLITVFVVPTLYCAIEERRLRHKQRSAT